MNPLPTTVAQMDAEIHTTRRRLHDVYRKQANHIASISNVQNEPTGKIVRSQQDVRKTYRDHAKNLTDNLVKQYIRRTCEAVSLLLPRNIRNIIYKMVLWASTLEDHIAADDGYATIADYPFRPRNPQHAYRTAAGSSPSILISEAVGPIFYSEVLGTWYKYVDMFVSDMKSLDLLLRATCSDGAILATVIRSFHFTVPAFHVTDAPDGAEVLHMDSLMKLTPGTTLRFFFVDAKRDDWFIGYKLDLLQTLEKKIVYLTPQLRKLAKAGFNVHIAVCSAARRIVASTRFGPDFDVTDFIRRDVVRAENERFQLFVEYSRNQLKLARLKRKLARKSKASVKRSDPDESPSFLFASAGSPPFATGNRTMEKVCCAQKSGKVPVVFVEQQAWDELHTRWFPRVFQGEVAMFRMEGLGFVFAAK